MDTRKVPPGDPDFKVKVRRWLREHIGEPIGPQGKHLPIPNLREIPKPLCSECDEPAEFHLCGWFANGDRVEVPLCGKHSSQASSFILKRKQELIDRDSRRKAART